MADPKRSLDIEAALRWAYRDELPRAGALNRAELDRPRRVDFVGRGREPETGVQMMLGMPTNCFGVLQAVGTRGAPHPDAVSIGDAVEALDAMVFGVPEDWSPLTDMGELSDEADRLVRAEVTAVSREIEGGQRLSGRRVSALVRRHALDDDAPDWSAVRPEVKVVSAFGKPLWFVRRARWAKTADGRDVMEEVEEDGYNARAKRPHPGAYRKLFLSPGPAPAIRARAEYEIWHAALDHLAADLAPRLDTIRLTPSRRPARPWAESDLAPSVLPDLSDMGPLEPLPGSPRRPTPSPGRRPPSAPSRAAFPALYAAR